MNILLIHPHDIYSSVEPWTVRICYLAMEFRKSGHQVRLVYFPLEWGKQKVAGFPEGITVIPLSRRHGPGILLKNIIRLYSLAAWADVVHFQKCFYHAAIPAIVSAFLRNKPLHYDWDDWEVKIYEVSTKPGVLRGIIKVFLYILEETIPRLADTVSVASSRLRKECLRLGVSESRIVDAHVGADIVLFNPKVPGQQVRRQYNISKPLVLYLGQLHGGQYVDFFISAAARLVGDFKKDYSFMIVGDGYQAQELKRLSLRLGLNGKLIFTGSVDHQLVPQYVAAADVCVACFAENEVTLCKSPLKIVEYMASGKAIVATNVGEVSAMLGKAGILTPPGDTDALAKGIIRFLEDSRLRRDAGIAARLRAEEEYNWTVTARNLLSAYKRQGLHGKL